MGAVVCAESFPPLFIPFTGRVDERGTLLDESLSLGRPQSDSLPTSGFELKTHVILLSGTTAADDQPSVVGENGEVALSSWMYGL